MPGPFCGFSGEFAARGLFKSRYFFRVQQPFLGILCLLCHFLTFSDISAISWFFRAAFPSSPGYFRHLLTSLGATAISWHSEYFGHLLTFLGVFTIDWHAQTFPPFLGFFERFWVFPSLIDFLGCFCHPLVFMSASVIFFTLASSPFIGILGYFRH
ncbi:hypothetical protein Taro_037692, partial [Colocasia esculenta]|nr:hypothetical protein [Colocasia esculenta]